MLNGRERVQDGKLQVELSIYLCAGYQHFAIEEHCLFNVQVHGTDIHAACALWYVTEHQHTEV